MSRYVVYHVFSLDYIDDFDSYFDARTIVEFYEEMDCFLRSFVPHSYGIYDSLNQEVIY